MYHTVRRLKCQRCGHVEIGENGFCSECLTSLLVYKPQDPVARWIGDKFFI